MALKALMLRKKIDDAKKALAAVEESMKDFEARRPRLQRQLKRLKLMKSVPQ